MRLFTLLAGNGAAALLGLARNLLAAMLLSLADYGLAATFLMVISLAEMLTQFGQSALIVADREGGTAEVLARYHGFNLLRGLLAAAGIAGGALVFSPVGLRGLYAALALVPAFGALQHFRQFQLQREGRVRVAAAIPAWSAAVSLVTLAAAAWVSPNANAVLAALIAQALCALILSHALSDRPYRLAFDLGHLAEDFRIGLPLLANGILLFLVLFGERLIVGHIFGLEILGLFAMGVTLTLTPSIILSKSLMSHYLPVVAREGQRATAMVMKAHLLAGVGLAVVVAVACPLLVDLVLPASFAPLRLILPLMGLQQGLRLAKAGQAVVGIGLGFRADELWVSLLRMAFLPIAYVVLARWGSLELLIWLAILAETAGLIAAMIFVAKRSLPKLVYGAP